MSKFLPFVSGNGINSETSSDGTGKLVSGIIEFETEIPIEKILNNSYNDTTHRSSSVSSNGTVVCLLVIPGFMIPGDIIHFFASYAPHILSFRIFRHHADPEKYLALIQLDTPQSTANILGDFDGQILSSLDPTECRLARVKHVSYKATIIDKASGMFRKVDSPRQSSLCPSTPIADSVLRAKSPLCDTIRTPDSDSSLLSPGIISTGDHLGFQSIADESQSSGFQNAESTSPSIVDEQEELCPVCLEPIANEIPMAFTMCCNHTFHIECAGRLEGPQCPVCRFQHDGTPISMTACQECGWQGTPAEIAALLSRYDEDEPSLDYMSEGEGDLGCDLWVCLICGFVGCGRTGQFHIKKHYEEEMHTYAMNTENRHVFDFAGGGYVHRLILQEEEIDEDGGGQRINEDGVDTVRGLESVSHTSLEIQLAAALLSDGELNESTGRGSFTASTSTSTGSRIIPLMSGGGHQPVAPPRRVKLVEVFDPRTESQERPQRAPITTEQEERAIHRKLEAAAYQYNQLLTWQLAQQREDYELRLARLRNFLHEETVALLQSGAPSSSSSTNSSSAVEGGRAVGGAGGKAKYGGNDGDSAKQRWKQAVARQMTSERSKVQRQLETANKRLQAAEKELSELRELSHALTENKEEWTSRVNTAQAKLTEDQASYRNWIGGLQKKVSDLMATLDGSASVPSSSVAPMVIRETTSSSPAATTANGEGSARVTAAALAALAALSPSPSHSTVVPSLFKTSKK